MNIALLKCLGAAHTQFHNRNTYFWSRPDFNKLNFKRNVKPEHYE